jgi:hypothetical protein
MVGYESVCRKLEEMAARPGLLLDQIGRAPGAHEDGEMSVRSSSVWQFDLP